MGERVERDATDVWEEPDEDDLRDPRVAALIEDKEGLPDEGDTLDQLVDDLGDDESGDGD
jgi:hypothetical protein